MINKVRKYKEYKRTGLTWLDKIPMHWNWMYLYQVCDEQKIKNSENMVNNVLSLSYGRIIRKKNINSGLLPNDYSTYQIVNEGNIILRLTDLQNDKRSLRTGLVKEKGIITSAYVCLKINQQNNPSYIRYLLHSFDIIKVFYGLGSGVRQSIGFKDIRKLRLPVPTISEQNQIVRYLDYQITKINKFLNSKKKLIAALKEQIECYIFGNDKRTETIDIKSWNTAFPKEWLFIKSKRIFKEIKIKNCINSELLAVTQDRGVVFKKDIEQNYVSPSGDLSALKLVRDGDFVISLRSFQGGIEYSEIEGIVSPAYNVFCLREEYSSIEYRLYYKYLFKTNVFISELNTLVTGIRDGKNISYSDFSNIPVPVPPIENVKEIAKLIRKYEYLKKQYNKEQTLLGEYQNRLTLDVVTGKIDVQDTTVNEIEEEIEDNVEVVDSEEAEV